MLLRVAGSHVENVLDVFPFTPPLEGESVTALLEMHGISLSGMKHLSTATQAGAPGS